MRQLVISLMLVAVLMTFAQTSSDYGTREHSRNRRGLEGLSRNRRTLLPILRKLRELKERGLRSVLGFKKLKKGRFLGFKKNPFPQFPFGIPAKPPTGGKPLPTVNFHNHKPHKTKPKPPPSSHYTKHKPQIVEAKPHYKQQKPQQENQNQNYEEQKEPKTEYKPHHVKPKPSLIVDSYGSPIAPAITEVDSYGSPLAPVSSSYDAPPVDVPNSYYAPAPTYETPAPAYSPIVTYVKETPASPPAYEPEVLSEPETSYAPETSYESDNSYDPPQPQLTYIEAEPITTYTKPTEPETLEVYSEPVEEVSNDPYKTIAIPPPYEAPAPIIHTKPQDPQVNSYETPVSNPIPQEQEPYEIPPEGQSDSYGNPIAPLFSSYSSPPQVDSYGTPISDPITSYITEQEQESYESPHEVQSDLYGTPVAPLFSPYSSPPQVDIYETPVSNPIPQEQEPEVQSDSYGTPVAPLFSPYSSPPQVDIYETPVSNPIPQEQEPYKSPHEVQSDSYGTPVAALFSPNSSPPQLDSYGTPVSSPVTTYAQEHQPSAQEQPLFTYYLPSSDSPVPAPDYVSQPITNSYGFPVSEPNSYGIPLSEPLTSYEPIIQEQPVPSIAENIPFQSDVIPESDSVQISPVAPQLPFVPESAPLNDVTNLTDFPEDSISEIVDQNSSSFFLNNPVISSPGEPIIMSTFDQQFEVSTTEESNDLLPEIFITTEASVIETAQFSVEAVKEDDTEIVPVAEPASEHPDAEGPVETNIADLVNLRDTDKYFFGFTEPQNLSTDDDDESPQGNFPGESETSDISVADNETSTATTTPPQTTPSPAETTNTEPNLNDDIEPSPEPDQEDNITNVDEGQEGEANESISNTNTPPTILKSDETPTKNNRTSTAIEAEQLASSTPIFFQFIESSTVPSIEVSTTEESNDLLPDILLLKDDAVKVNEEFYESDSVPKLEDTSSLSPVASKKRRPQNQNAGKRKIIRKKLKGNKNGLTVSTNLPKATENNRGNDDITKDVDILSKEVEENSTATEKLILPTPQQIPPFNSLNALFPYYNVDPESITNEDLMPVLIEDIFLSEDYLGEGDYDLLPFYDLDNYDLEFEDSFLVYDATSDGDTERAVPSFYL